VAKAASLAPEQLRALDRLKTIAGIDQFYLAGASAVAWHLHHRRSVDLDLFSRSPRASLSKVEAAAAKLHDVVVLDTNDIMVALEVGRVPVDIVKYPYPPLDPPLPGPSDFPVAQPRDLAAMKLAAIGRRGIKRDFWDFHELARSGVSLPDAARAYLEKFGRTKADLYAVQRALTWFADAESDVVPVQGLTSAHWKRIKSYFLEAAPRLFEDL